jgi:hypothetical protein
VAEIGHEEFQVPEATREKTVQIPDGDVCSSGQPIIQARNIEGCEF